MADSDPISSIPRTPRVEPSSDPAKRRKPEERRKRPKRESEPESEDPESEQSSDDTCGTKIDIRA